MSLVGELKYFLGLQIKQVKEGIFISHTKQGYALLPYVFPHSRQIVEHELTNTCVFTT